MAKRFEVRGVDTYEVQTATFPERAYFPLAEFDAEADARAFAEAQARLPASADPNLCDRVEIVDREAPGTQQGLGVTGVPGRVVWSAKRPSE